MGRKTVTRTSEGVEIIEESFDAPIREGKDIEQRFYARFDFIVFQKAGKEPVFWVREAENNTCTEEHLRIMARAPRQSESVSRGLLPSQVHLFEESKKGEIKQTQFFSPTYDKLVERDPEIKIVDIETIDRKIKETLDIKENLATKHIEQKRFDKETRLDQAEMSTNNDLEREKRLWNKLKELEEGDELAQKKKKGNDL